MQMRTRELFDPVLLREAVDPEVFRVTNAIRRDASLAPLFTRPTGKVDAETLHAAFIAYIMPHHAIRRFMQARQTEGFHWVGHDFRRVLDLIKASPEQREYMATNLANMFRDLVKAAKAAKDGRFSSHTRQEIKNWINSNGYHHDLSKTALAELNSTEGIRPTKPIVLYRGLLFKSWQMKRSELARQFLMAARSGDRTIQHIWDKASSWSTDKHTAERFAMYGPASSAHAATMNMLMRMKQNDHIDGDLGVLVSVLARPQDIIADLDQIEIDGNHGHEGEMILKPGSYLVKIIAMHDRDGPIDLHRRREEANKETRTERILADVEKAVAKLDGVFTSPFHKHEKHRNDWLLHPDTIAQAVSHAIEFGERLDDILGKLRPVLSQVEERDLKETEIHPDNPVAEKHLRQLRSVFSHIAALRGSHDTKHPFAAIDAKTILAAIEVPLAYRMLNSNDYDRDLHRAIMTAKTGDKTTVTKNQSYSKLTPAKQAERLREIFEDAIRAAGKSVPSDWQDVVKQTRLVMAGTGKIMGIAILLHDLCTLIRTFHGSHHE